MGTFAGVDAWAGAVADGRAETVAARLRRDLPAADPGTLLLAPERVVGGFALVRTAPGGIEVRVEAAAAWQRRCVVAFRANDGAVRARTTGGACP